MLLINPQRNRENQLGPFAAIVPLTVPFGIGFIAGYLISLGKRVTIVDEEISPLSAHDLEEYTKTAVPPYIFGISCLTANIGRGYEIAARLKARFPDSKVIMGGIHPTVLPEEALMQGFVDIIVRNEGEETALKLYEKIKAFEDYSDLDGISLRQNGGIIHNKPAPLINLENLPGFPFPLFEKFREKYLFGFLANSRGCPYECIFCSQRSITGKFYRVFPLMKTIETLDLLIHKHGQKEIVFTDDNFVVSTEKTIDLAKSMIFHGLHQTAYFSCQLRADVVSEELLYWLRKANFATLNFGIETASNRLMKVIKKGETVEEQVRAVKLAKKFGFGVTATFILGLPTETASERKQAYLLANRLNLDFARFNNATPYPGTELYAIADRERGLRIEKNWENLNACGTLVWGADKKLAYVPNTATEKELKRDILWFNVGFSLRPKRLFHFLKAKSSQTSGWVNFSESWYKWVSKLPKIWAVVMHIARNFLKVVRA